MFNNGHLKTILEKYGHTVSKTFFQYQSFVEEDLDAKKFLVFSLQ